MDGTKVNVDVKVYVSVVEEEINVNNVQSFVHNFHSEGQGEVGSGDCVSFVHNFPLDGEGAGRGEVGSRVGG